MATMGGSYCAPCPGERLAVEPEGRRPRPPDEDDLFRGAGRLRPDARHGRSLSLAASRSAGHVDRHRPARRPRPDPLAGGAARAPGLHPRPHLQPAAARRRRRCPRARARSRAGKPEPAKPVIPTRRSPSFDAHDRASAGREAAQAGDARQAGDGAGGQRHRQRLRRARGDGGRRRRRRGGRRAGRRPRRRASAGRATGPVIDYDQPPRPIKITRPQYPQEAFVKKIEGTVEVEILIDSTGHGRARARGAGRSRSSTPRPSRPCQQWVFTPAIKNGRPVATIATPR